MFLFFSHVITYLFIPPDGPENLTVLPKKRVIQAGSNITISCEAGSNPTAHYSWTVNEKPWSAPNVVKISNVKSNYTGNYVCTATNPGSSITKSEAMLLRIFGKWMLGTSGPMSGAGVDICCLFLKMKNGVGEEMHFTTHSHSHK